VCLIAGCGRIGFADLPGDGALTADPSDGSSSGLATWSHVTVDGHRTRAVHAAKAYCWGDNNSGQLGNSSGRFAKSPSLVTPLKRGDPQGLHPSSR
jgi:hypothetical protein